MTFMQTGLQAPAQVQEVPICTYSRVGDTGSHHGASACPSETGNAVPPRIPWTRGAFPKCLPRTPWQASSRLVLVCRQTI